MSSLLIVQVHDLCAHVNQLLFKFKQVLAKLSLVGLFKHFIPVVLSKDDCVLLRPPVLGVLVKFVIAFSFLLIFICFL